MALLFKQRGDIPDRQRRHNNRVSCVRQRNKGDLHDTPSPGSEAKSGSPSSPPIVVAAFERAMNKSPPRLTEHSHAQVIFVRAWANKQPTECVSTGGPLARVGGLPSYSRGLLPDGCAMNDYASNCSFTTASRAV